MRPRQYACERDLIGVDDLLILSNHCYFIPRIVFCFILLQSYYYLAKWERVTQKAQKTVQSGRGHGVDRQNLVPLFLAALMLIGQ